MVHSVKSHIHFTLFYGQRMQVGAEATAVEEAAVETQGEAFSEVKISRHSVSLSPRSLLKHSLPFQLPGDQCLQRCSAQLWGVSPHCCHFQGKLLCSGHVCTRVLESLSGRTDSEDLQVMTKRHLSRGWSEELRAAVDCVVLCSLDSWAWILFLHTDPQSLRGAVSAHSWFISKTDLRLHCPRGKDSASFRSGFSTFS